MTALANPGLASELERSDEFNADACMNCGVCSAVCPMGVEILPRRLFRYVLLGMEQKLAEETETVYSCLLCKMCEENCPSGVHIAENVRTLRHHIIRTVFGIGEG
jgi:heterodisulfide reductase subunit C